MFHFLSSLLISLSALAAPPVIWFGQDAKFINPGTIQVPSLGAGVCKVSGTGLFSSSLLDLSTEVTGTLSTTHMVQSSSSTSGWLSSTDWTIFNNKLDASSGNYITNPTFEVNTTGWNLYNDSGNTIPASVIVQDITYTSALSGGAGNGATVSYVLCGGSYVGPVVTCPSGTAVQVCWYNGPSIAQNPTATVLKAAYDAVPCAVAIATAAITGTASNRQYLTGTATLGGGGDASPVDGTGGSPSGVTFTQNTSTPLIGTASGDLGKSASNEQGQGVSTDFTINSVDTNQTLQISFVYSGSAGMTLGSSSDAKVFVYDVTNAVLIPVSPSKNISGPVSTAKTFVGTFPASSSVSYRLIIHIATTSAAAWDLLIDSVTINNQVTASAATQVPSVVIKNQPISGSVTDHMVVMWLDGATQWVPATIAGAALPVFGTDVTALGFATNILGSTADIYVAGAMDGFSFGPFAGYNQYIDTTAGLISPLPSPFTSLFVPVGKAISSTVLDINFAPHINMISNGSGVPIKGGILTSNGANDGTLDSVLSPGTNGQFLMANSGSTNGIAWFSPVGTAPIVYTAATHAWSCTTATGSVTGCLSSTDWTTFNNKLTATLASTNIFVGSSGNVATARAMSGDATLGNTGVLTIANNAVTNAKAAQMAAHTFKGNNTGSTANALDLTANQLSAELNSSIVNSSAVTGTTVTDALNTLNQSFQEVYLSAINNGTAVTANTAIPTWTTVSKDTLNGFVASTGIYTIQTGADGDYEVKFNAATTTGTPIAQIYKNGTLVQTGVGSGVRTSAVMIIPNLVAGDTITVALDSTLTLTSTNTDTTLNIAKVSGNISAQIYASAHSATATVTSSLSDISWTTEDKDTHAALSGSTFTVPTGGSGMYHALCAIAITATTVAAGQAQVIAMLKNGSEISRYTFIAGAATQKPNVLTVDSFFSAAATDTVKCQVSSASTTPTVSASTTQNRMFIYKVTN